jgi:membrane-associated phospholipid phosphatase
MTISAFLRLVLIALIAWGGVAAVTFQWDEPVRERIVASQEPKWSKSPEGKMHGAIRKWGDWPWIMVAATLCVALARWRGNRRWTRILLAAMVASTLAGMLANASRLTSGRTRPRESPKIEQGFYGPYHDGRLLIGVPAYNSFPSGHTATAFGFAAVVLIAAPGWGVLVLVPAALVAWSSIMIGAHHPSDVAVSIVLSFAVAWGVWRVTVRRFPLP